MGRGEAVRANFLDGIPGEGYRPLAFLRCVLHLPTFLPICQTRVMLEWTACTVEVLTWRGEARANLQALLAFPCSGISCH